MHRRGFIAALFAPFVARIPITLGFDKHRKEERISREVLIILSRNLRMSGTIAAKYESELAVADRTIGQTLQIRRPPRWGTPDWMEDIK